MSNLQGNPSVGADIGQINPDHINARLLKDITEIIDPIISSALPKNGVVFQMLYSLSSKFVYSF